MLLIPSALAENKATEVETKPKVQTLPRNVRIFDGMKSELSSPNLGAVTNQDNLKIIMKDGVIYQNTPD